MRAQKPSFNFKSTKDFASTFPSCSISNHAIGDESVSAFGSLQRRSKEGMSSFSRVGDLGTRGKKTSWRMTPKVLKLSHLSLITEAKIAGNWKNESLDHKMI